MEATTILTRGAGCSWRALPKEWFDSASAMHARFLQGEPERACVFAAISSIPLLTVNGRSRELAPFV